jgi:acetyltransferase-like isoleucine patch superfamily enzyme
MKPIISSNCRIRHPEHFVVGDGSIIDDWSYFSARVMVGRYSHIASGCTIAGGPGRQFSLGDFSSISSGVRVFCKSNDFVNDLVMISPAGVDIGDKPIEGDVSIADMCGVGANAVIMPGNNIPEGTVVGALSFVPHAFDFEPWSVYAGTPLRLVKRRNKDNVLRQAARMKEFLTGVRR